MIFGDLTQFASQSAGAVRVGRLLEYLESAHHNGSDDNRNLIDVSFLENLPLKSPLISQLGPVLARRSRELDVGR